MKTPLPCHPAVPLETHPDGAQTRTQASLVRGEAGELPKGPPGRRAPRRAQLQGGALHPRDGLGGSPGARPGSVTLGGWQDCSYREQAAAAAGGGVGAGQPRGAMRA